jgi:hypothetical protein
MGDPDVRRTAGPLTHTSEFSAVRLREGGPPAVLMVAGTQLKAGGYAVTSNKPVTLSLEGTRGALLSHQPDTRVEIRSMDIRAGQRFLLENEEFPAADGTLMLLLARPGLHELRPAFPSGSIRPRTAARHLKN